MYPVQKLYFFSFEEPFIQFRKTLFAWGSNFEELVTSFSLHISTHSDSFCHHNEDLLFYFFSPLLVFLPIKKETAQNILRIAILQPFSYTSISKDLIKKCILMCPDFPENHAIIFKFLQNDFKSIPKDYAGRTHSKTKKIDFDFLTFFKFFP